MPRKLSALPPKPTHSINQNKRYIISDKTPLIKNNDIKQRKAKHIKFLNDIINRTPNRFRIELASNSSEAKRVEITSFDKYDSFYNMISKMTDDEIISRYFDELYNRRSELLPSTSDLSYYITPEDIPNPMADYTKYNHFFNELRSSLKKTFAVLDNVEAKAPTRNEER